MTLKLFRKKVLSKKEEGFFRGAMHGWCRRLRKIDKDYNYIDNATCIINRRRNEKWFGEEDV